MQLELLFNRYFTGMDKRPPIKQMTALQKAINILTINTHLAKTAAEQFHLKSLTQQFTTYRRKWERGIRDIEEGRIKPGQQAFGGMGMSAADQAEMQGSDDEMGHIQHLTNEVDSAVETYVKLAEEHLGKNYSTESVKTVLESKLGGIRAKYGDGVSLSVVYEDGTIKIKPKK
ncbi:hypothetical protein KAH37_06540 [bacterium]|nr:hypothetical protein [bacterium]